MFVMFNVQLIRTTWLATGLQGQEFFIWRRFTALRGRSSTNASTMISVHQYRSSTDRASTFSIYYLLSNNSSIVIIFVWSEISVQPPPVAGCAEQIWAKGCGGGGGTGLTANTQMAGLSLALTTCRLPGGAVVTLYWFAQTWADTCKILLPLQLVLYLQQHQFQGSY